MASTKLAQLMQLSAARRLSREESPVCIPCSYASKNCSITSQDASARLVGSVLVGSGSGSVVVGAGAGVAGTAAGCRRRVPPSSPAVGPDRRASHVTDPQPAAVVQRAVGGGASSQISASAPVASAW